jgi:hypothetical protein
MAAVVAGEQRRLVRRPLVAGDCASPAVRAERIEGLMGHGFEAPHGSTMAPVFPEGFRSSSKGIGEPIHPVVITCLQWDCDGALNDWDRQWMLQKLTAAESRGLVEGSLSPGGD